MLAVARTASPGDHHSPTPAPDRRLTQTAHPHHRSIFTILIGALFALIGLLLTAFFSIPLWMELSELPSYVPIPATVLHSEVKTHSGDNTTYSVHIRYRYRMNGLDYESDRYSLHKFSSSSYADKARTVADFPPGRTFTCYVSPTHPERAVIRQGWQWSYLLTGAPLVFLVAGLALVGFGIKGPSPPILSQPTTRRSAGLVPGLPTELKPQQTSGTRFFGVLTAALFWNGITGIFVWQAWQSFAQGEPEWLLALFIVPFVIIGLLLIAGTVYAAAALWNPSFNVRLIPPAAIGLPLRLEWACRGSTARIAALRLTLIGQEVMIYSSGSGKNRKTHELRSTFYRQTLTDTTERPLFASGTIEVLLPSDGVLPSLDGNVCRVEWTLKLSACIPHWPDVRADFILPIEPFPTGGLR